MESEHLEERGGGPLNGGLGQVGEIGEKSLASFHLVVLLYSAPDQETKGRDTLPITLKSFESITRRRWVMDHKLQTTDYRPQTIDQDCGPDRNRPGGHRQKMGRYATGPLAPGILAKERAGKLSGLRSKTEGLPDAG